MASTIKAVRGTRDLLPPETVLWSRVEATARVVFARYGFGEIRTPVFEETSLFSRSVGEETDIVSKEMYTWEDGERFDPELLKQKWIKDNSSCIEVLGQDYNPGLGHVDLLIKIVNKDEFELIDFRLQESQDSIATLIQAVDAAKSAGSSAPTRTFGKPVVGRLVVQANSGKASIKQTSGIVVEEVPGRFYKSSQSLTLRPENTAGVVRAYIEHKLGDSGQLQKLFYIGPQFRRERPQRGRYRQFWQIGAEVIGPQSSGSESPIRDAEVLEMLAALLDELGVKGWKLEINSVGSSEDRRRYNAALREALAPVKAQLCEDNQRRAETNPLRVLDSKAPEDQEIINALPKIADYWDESSRAHFAAVLEALDACGVQYTVNPRLVRGLDYYTRTTFEFTVPDGSGLGTQNALLGGGRYDGLSEMLGGPRAPGIGFAIGEDRLILTLQAQFSVESFLKKRVDIYLAPLGQEQNSYALVIAKHLRNVWRPVLRTRGFAVEVGEGSFRLKKSFETAEKISRFIGILGEDERLSNNVKLKDFTSGEQFVLNLEQLTGYLEKYDITLKSMGEAFTDAMHLSGQREKMEGL